MSERPHISPLLVRWFTWYSRGFIRKHFHSLRISSSGGFNEHVDRPIVLYTNHASWWDPLVGLVVVNSLFPKRALYAPIDALMLAKYRMFGRMGFFGVEKDTRKGAIDFLTTSTQMLGKSDAILAVTAQGRFADVRERPANIKRGLAHLSMRVPSAIFIPACIEYVFWEEKLPEVLVRFGEPIVIGNEAMDFESQHRRLESALEKTQNELAELSKSRLASAFAMLISGKAGLGGVYDRWRSVRARLRGEEFTSEIGSL
jgi:1-acyl-sn-glycerol-3-phosphate acyltransferase